MKRKLFIVFTITIALISLQLGAEEKKISKKGAIGDYVENSNSNYGMAGCGLGSVLFGESESRGLQLLAATTNGIYWNNTFAMSSGTSNCNTEKPDSVADMKKI